MAGFALDESLGYLINRTAVRLRRELAHAFTSNGHTVTPEQWALLNRLWEQEGLTQVELAEMTFKDKPNVTRMLEVLEKQGLIYRQPDEIDRRASRVFLTDAGRQLKDQLIPLAEGVLVRGQRTLTSADIEQLRKLLDTIYYNFE